MTTPFLSVAWSIMLVKTLLVADNICERHGQCAVLRRVSASWKKARLASSQSPSTSRPAGQAHASRFRCLHLHLLMAHITACVSTGASLAREALAYTEASCRMTQKIFIAATILHQASIVLFLESKTEVTKITRTESQEAPHWQRGVKVFARFWGYVCLPLSTVMAGTLVINGLTKDSGCCNSMYHAVNTDSHPLLGLMFWFVVPQVVLVSLLILLLAVFILPLVSTSWSSASTGISYRRIVVRNIVCAAAITLMIVARTVLTLLTISNIAVFPDKLDDGITHTSSALVQVATLCFTEITIAIGFTSCFSTLKDEASKWGSDAADKPGTVEGATAAASSLDGDLCLKEKQCGGCSSPPGTDVVDDSGDAETEDGDGSV